MKSTAGERKENTYGRGQKWLEPTQTEFQQFETDNVGLGENTSVHDTLRFDVSGNITNSHTKVTFEGKSMRIGH